MSSPVPDRDAIRKLIAIASDPTVTVTPSKAMYADDSADLLAALEATEVERDEAESFANEGWMWLDEALSALGVGAVFDIKAAGEKRVAAEARTVQLEAALRRTIDWLERGDQDASRTNMDRYLQDMTNARRALQADQTGDTT